MHKLLFSAINMIYSHMQRVYGFAICLGLGLLFGFLVSHLLTRLRQIADRSAVACFDTNETKVLFLPCSPVYSS